MCVFVWVGTFLYGYVCGCEWASVFMWVGKCVGVRVGKSVDLRMGRWIGGWVFDLSIQHFYESFFFSESKKSEISQIYEIAHKRKMTVLFSVSFRLI